MGEWGATTWEAAGAGIITIEGGSAPSLYRQPSIFLVSNCELPLLAEQPYGGQEAVSCDPPRDRETALRFEEVLPRRQALLRAPSTSGGRRPQQHPADAFPAIGLEPDAWGLRRKRQVAFDCLRYPRGTNSRSNRRKLGVLGGLPIPPALTPLT